MTRNEKEEITECTIEEEKEKKKERRKEI